MASKAELRAAGDKLATRVEQIADEWSSRSMEVPISAVLNNIATDYREETKKKEHSDGTEG